MWLSSSTTPRPPSLDTRDKSPWTLKTALPAEPEPLRVKKSKIKILKAARLKTKKRKYPPRKKRQKARRPGRPPRPREQGGRAEVSKSRRKRRRFPPNRRRPSPKLMRQVAIMVNPCLLFFCRRRPLPHSSPASWPMLRGHGPRTPSSKDYLHGPGPPQKRGHGPGPPKSRAYLHGPRPSRSRASARSGSWVKPVLGGLVKVTISLCTETPAAPAGPHILVSPLP